MASTWPAKNNYATGDVLTAANMNGVGDDLNDVYNFSGYAAGKNKILNSDFGIWQRGTSFSNPSNGTYTADRWFVELDGTGYTRTISQQTFTPGTAPVSGYEGTYFFRWNNSVAGTGNTINALSTRLEDIRTLAGQTVTFSFWGKADASRALTVYAYQQSTGGSATVTTTLGTATLTTSWARYTMTASLPSLSGITIGTNSNLQIRIAMPTGTTMTCDFWGVQLEAGSTVSIFQTATGTKQGELAACQRYCLNLNSATANGGYLRYTNGECLSTTEFSGNITLPVPMRTTPSVTTTGTASNYAIYHGAGITACSNVPSIGANSTNNTLVNFYTTVASGLTVGRAAELMSNNNQTSYLLLTAEL